MGRGVAPDGFVTAGKDRISTIMNFFLTAVSFISPWLHPRSCSVRCKIKEFLIWISQCIYIPGYCSMYMNQIQCTVHIINL